MSVNFTAYPAWNDPYNPWPRYSQVVLSAADIPLNTLTLDYFYPDRVNNPSQIAIHYVSDDGYHELYYTNYADSIFWEANYDGGTAVYSQNLSSGLILPRAVPTKTVGLSGNWKADGGTDVESLYIQPITTSLTDWEKRRKRLLEYR